jgi:hypothetical protein
VILNPPLDHLAMVSFKPSVLREFDAAADIRARPLDMSHWVAGRLHLDYANSDPDRQLLFIAHLWGDGEVIVFDTRAGRVITRMQGVASAHGVLANAFASR